MEKHIHFSIKHCNLSGFSGGLRPPPRPPSLLSLGGFALPEHHPSARPSVPSGPSQSVPGPPTAGRKTNPNSSNQQNVCKTIQINQHQNYFIELNVGVGPSNGSARKFSKLGFNNL